MNRLNTRAELLARRRRDLIAACAMQREDIASQAQSLQHVMTSFDAGLRILNRIERHPGWLAAAAGGLMAIRPRRLSSLLRLGTAGLRTWRQWSPVLRYLPQRD